MENKIPDRKRPKFLPRFAAYLTFGAAAVTAFFGISFYIEELQTPPEMIPAFLQIAPGLYRGGQPTEEGFEYLNSLGVKTVLNFRKEGNLQAWEKETVERHGMKYLEIPWKIYETPSPEIAARFLDVLEDSSNRPLFIHCKHGVDRTGVMTALYYIKYENLSPEEAIEKSGKIFPPHKRWFFFVNRHFRFFTKELQKSLFASTSPSEE